MELAAASVSRSVDLPVSAEEAWASISDASRLTGWLGDVVDLEIVPGATGTVAEGGVVRRVVVTEIDAGRSIGFVWWDEAVPESASVVSIDLVPGEDGSTRVTVTERLAGSATASLGEASVADLCTDAGAAWDRRLRALVGEPARSVASV